MRLVTERLILRPWEDKDRSAMAAIYGDAKVRQFYCKVLTAKESNAQIDLEIERAQTNGFDFQAAQLKDSGETIGMIGLSFLPQADWAMMSSPVPRVEIGWVLAKNYWGQGLASEGARAWLDYAWSIGIPEVAAITAKVNTPSQRVMQRIGMTYDPKADYEDPRFGKNQRLRQRVVYRTRRPRVG